MCTTESVKSVKSDLHNFFRSTKRIASLFMTSLTDVGKNMTEHFTGELTGPVACPRTDSYTVK